MPLTYISFSPSTKAKSAEVTTNFQTVVNALNNLRPTIFAYLPGAQFVSTSVTGQYKVHTQQTLYFDSVDLLLTVACTGAALIVDINKNGVSIFTTRPQIADGATSGGSGAAFIGSASLSDGDILTFDVDQVGSSAAGENLSIALAMKL